MRIRRDITFEAAHRLPFVPSGHKCGEMHGHSYRVTVECEGPVQAEGEERGMVIDFARIDRVKELLEHSTLNDVIENPTSEVLAEWIAGQVGPLCTRVTVAETKRSKAEWRRKTDGP